MEQKSQDKSKCSAAFVGPTHSETFTKLQLLIAEGIKAMKLLNTEGAGIAPLMIIVCTEKYERNKALYYKNFRTK